MKILCPLQASFVRVMVKSLVIGIKGAFMMRVSQISNLAMGKALGV